MSYLDKVVNVVKTVNNELKELYQLESASADWINNTKKLQSAVSLTDPKASALEKLLGAINYNTKIEEAPLVVITTHCPMACLQAYRYGIVKSTAFNFVAMVAGMAITDAMRNDTEITDQAKRELAESLQNLRNLYK